ncbi:MAG: DUF1631 domain-containing protein, partial [Candidatus Thiodiazotropha taylori]|nr:DUF1631 domain-containing protein [Candidatus Thiodiazotropha taylori]MCW4251396.1 DUF1631 domain-containing protein [Candidatus Thiodiazotropha taylori]
MQRQDNIITFGSAVPHQKNISLNANGRRISSECRNLVIKAIPKLMNDLFENLDDSLYEMA